MLVFFFWFAVLWRFIGIFADILRRDLSGWAKAALLHDEGKITANEFELLKQQALSR
jgi:hypothetical protein